MTTHRLVAGLRPPNPVNTRQSLIAHRSGPCRTTECDVTTKRGLRGTS